MTTEQDQQSRADFERELIANRQFKPSDFCFIDGAYTGDDDVQFAWDVWQAARALPAGMEPVAEVLSSRPGNDTSVIDKAMPAGAKLYTTAQAQAMGRVPPGWQAVPVDLPDVMVDAFENAMEAATTHVRNFRAAWHALLAAAPRPPAAQKHYRLLQRNVDTIQADDEFLRDDAATWKTDPKGIFVGMPYMSNVPRPARRAIEPTP
ncbi:MAG: hypothetical protein RR928_18505 [Comamonas sp.]|uniref:hypothetical protein n=1 Tax=Comamonas sp. TaxID=34028 RepID=UPI002FC9D532